MSKQSKFDLTVVESAAKGKDAVGVAVVYFDRDKEVEYTWENRRQVKWSNVRRVSLRLAKSTWYALGNGDSLRVDRTRVKPR